MEFNPYSTAKPWMKGYPQWMPDEDGLRVESYSLYEQMYWSVPETFQLTQLGTDEDPIYVPKPKVVVEAILRYLCVNWGFEVDPEVGSEAERKEAVEVFKKLFKRETMYAKFASQLRYCLIRGDAVWHLTADPNKPAGKRISIHELDPATYFPIHDEDDPEKLVGVHIVDQFEEPDFSVRIRRQTYRKVMDEFGVFTGEITSQCDLFEIAGWDDRNLDPNEIRHVRTITPMFTLPKEITQLPVYHWRNNPDPTNEFGSSQFRGVERLFAAINQTISDEDLAVALAGLGVYATDSNAPVDENGNEVNWLIGPGRVVELTPGTDFKRVTGVSSVTPSQDHVKYLEAKVQEASGVPDIAVGLVDSTIAESGIALALKMAPLIASNAEKELEIIGKTDQMLYDLQTMWLPAYEGVNLDGVIVESRVDNPLPRNKAAEIQEVLSLATSNPPLLTIQEARARLSELGYDLTGTVEEIMAQMNAAASAADPFGARLADESNAAEEETTA